MTDTEIDIQCRRCGSSMGWEKCSNCGGEGSFELDDWDCSGQDDWVPCYDCGGAGGLWWCLSSEDYCEGHPLPGREDVERHTEEWFNIPPLPVKVEGEKWACRDCPETFDDIRDAFDHHRASHRKAEAT